MKEENEKIEVVGARVHNLKNINVTIPRDTLTVITGLSGSGKSSLAFDTIFAEGQRRYIETFSSYARSFLGGLERPEVDQITGLSPVIAIEQKTTNRNPRSTIGTTTEIYDFLRLLYARAGEAYSYLSGEKMVKYSEEEIIELIIGSYIGRRVLLLSPLVNNRKGHYQELLEGLRKKGYLSVRIDGKMRELMPGMKLDRYKNHTIELVVDKMIVSNVDERRLRESVRMAMKQGDGVVIIYDVEKDTIRHFSRRLMCPSTGLAYSEPAPHNFSFNSPKGACSKCKGLGYVNQFDIQKIIPDPTKSIAQGGIAPLGKPKVNLLFRQIEALGKKHDFTLKTPLSEFSEDAIDEIMNGTSEPLMIENSALGSVEMSDTFEGVLKQIEAVQEYESSMAQRWVNQFVTTSDCPECHGQRLNREALHYKIDGKNIAELSQMDILELYEWINGLEDRLEGGRRLIATEIVKEIRSRLRFLLDVGLEYLNLNRASQTLSGGESQRIRLATQIGSQLVNVLYILDEPSIGLHQRDNTRLINSLKRLRDAGNSVIVVEHDKEIMMESDYIIDMGPHAGRLGGEVIFSGTPKEMMRRSLDGSLDTLTADYLSGRKEISVPKVRRKGNGHSILLRGATGHNLKGVTVGFPLGKLICVTGVSGSGKSSLVNGTLYPILSKHFYRSIQEPLPYESIEGVEHIDKIINVDQSPLGRTPRSNPATYTNIFSDIRTLFVGLPDAKIRGYKPGRFSFNVAGGRCEVCSGNGYKTIGMNFLPDVFVPCEVCHGKRYNRETLEVRFKGKSIADVLDMTINQAVEFFENVPQILHKIQVLQDVGLGYIKLGQPSTTLSGGESQRIKLAAELSKKDTGKTLYILDEPTTGLHFDDIRILMSVINRLVDKGNTVIVIEHNMDVIKCADHIIDMGPEGGIKGGLLLCEGTPEEVCRQSESFTTLYLKQELENPAIV